MSIKTGFASAILVITVVCWVSVAGEVEQIHLRVSAPKMDSVDVPVHAVIELPERLAGVPIEEISVELIQLGNLFANVSVPGQIVINSAGKTELWWVMPWAKTNSASTWIATLNRETKANKRVFSWKDRKGDYLDLLFDGHKVTRYMYAYDTSSPQRTFETYKPFLHVFDTERQNLLTNGPDGISSYQNNKIKFPHHRGIFVGWNRLTFEEQQYDLWHMTGVAQVHQKFLELVAGPVLARLNSLIKWTDKKGESIIVEQRETTVFRQKNLTVLLLEFRTELKAVRGDVFLNGDPEHAGFQYRAHNDVASGSTDVRATYLFHKDDINPKRDKNLPWVGMSYGLNGRRYSVQHMNHPDNPKPTIYSAYRDYGRFGAFFKQKINANETLTLRYRIWIGRGEMPKRQELTSKYSAFVDSPKVQVLKR